MQLPSIESITVFGVITVRLNPNILLSFVKTHESTKSVNCTINYKVIAGLIKTIGIEQSYSIERAFNYQSKMRKIVNPKIRLLTHRVVIISSRLRRMSSTGPGYLKNRQHSFNITQVIFTPRKHFLQRYIILDSPTEHKYYSFGPPHNGSYDKVCIVYVFIELDV